MYIYVCGIDIYMYILKRYIYLNDCLSLVFGSVICSNLFYSFWHRGEYFECTFHDINILFLKTLSHVLYENLGKI